MSSEAPLTRKIPIFNQDDGTQIMDAHGNVFEYNLEQDEWVYKGQIPCPGIVTEEQAGLVSPQIQRRLNHLDCLIQEGVDFSQFKLFTRVESTPYFYLFNSSDGLIKFSPEITVTPLELSKQDYVSGVTTSTGNVTTFGFNRTPFNRNVAGETIEFLTGALRREKFEVISNTTTTLTFAGPNDVAIGDIFRVFTPAVTTKKLRAEVDRNRLYEILTRECCVGPKGNQGEKGLPGNDGEPADLEVFQPVQTASDDTIVVETTVNTPIDTPVSLRIFSQEVQILEVNIPLDLEGITITINDEDVDIEESSLLIEFDSGELYAEIKFLAGVDDVEALQFKARQRGPQGPAGIDGSSFFRIQSQMIDDPEVVSEEAITSLRKSNLDDTILFNRQTLFNQVCVGNFRPASDGELTASALEETALVALQVTTRDCKSIGLYRFAVPEFITPNLDLPQWTPTSECVDPRRFNQLKLDWFQCLEDKVPFRVFPNPKPPEKCCADDFFFCPNVGDQPCGVEVKTPPSPAPPLIEDSCPCENPIAFEVQNGGFVFDPLDDEGSNSIETIIDGCPQLFTQQARITGQNRQIRVTLESSTEACPDDNDFFIPDCPVDMTVVVTGDCPIANPIVQTTGIPAIAEFDINNVAGECDLTINISLNNNQSDCCRAVTITPEIPPDEGTDGTDDGGTVGTDIVGTVSTDEAGDGGEDEDKELGGGPFQPFPPDVELTPAPEEPEVSPPVLPDKLTPVIEAVEIDNEGNVCITGANFTDNVDAVAWLSESGQPQSTVVIVNDGKLTTTVPVPIPPGSEVLVQLLTPCPPGLSNVASAVIPEDMGEMEPDDFIIAQMGPSDTRWIYTDVFRIPGNFEANTNPVPAPTSDGDGSLSIEVVKNSPFTPLTHQVSQTVAAPFSSFVLDIAGASAIAFEAEATFAAAMLQIQLIDGSSNSATSTAISIATGGLQNYSIPTTEFAGVDLSDIVAIDYVLEPIVFPSPPGMYWIDNVRAVGATSPSFTPSI